VPDQLGQFCRRHVAEHLAAADHGSHHRPDRARHANPPCKGNGGTREEPAQLLLDVAVRLLMALALLKLLEGVAVALVEAYELPVADDLVDELVEESRPCVCENLSVAEVPDPLEDVPAEPVEPEVELEEDVLFMLEVVVERRLRDPESVGDLAQRGLVVALIVEQLEGDVEDALPRGASGPPAPRALSTLDISTLSTISC
jgi:hypothetical protein